MKTKISFRETLAWIVLVCAAFLFTATVALAQDNSKAKKGRTTIKITKKEDGKTTKIDTSFESGDQEAVEKILRDMGIDHDMSFDFNFPEPPSASAFSDKTMKMRHHGMSKKEREQLAEEMKGLKEDMKDLHEKLKDIHIEIFSDKDGEGSGYSYNFEMPEMPDVPFPPGAGFNSSDEMNKEWFYHRSELPEEAEALNDDDHVIVRGDDGEQPPVFEKEVTGKNGEKVFVYKRSKPAGDKSKESVADSYSLKVYPNPNNGKFTVSLNAEKKGNLSIRIFDTQGKEVYGQTISDFSGEYSNQVDLSGKKKGNYTLKITQGGKSMTEKFVIE